MNLRTLVPDRDQTWDMDARWRVRLSARHRQVDTVFSRRRNSFLVSSVCVPRYTRAGIVGKHTLEAHAHLGSAIRDDHLPRVQRVADADSPSVVE